MNQRYNYIDKWLFSNGNIAAFEFILDHIPQKGYMGKIADNSMGSTVETPVLERNPNNKEIIT